MPAIRHCNALLPCARACHVLNERPRQRSAHSTKSGNLLVATCCESVQDEAGVSKELQRRAAESLLCIMSLLSAVLPRLEHLDR